MRRCPARRLPIAHSWPDALDLPPRPPCSAGPPSFDPLGQVRYTGRCSCCMSAAAGAAAARPIVTADLGSFEGDKLALSDQLATTSSCRYVLALHRAGTSHHPALAAAQPSNSIARSRADSSVAFPPCRPPAGPTISRRRRSRGHPGDPGRRLRGQHPPLGRRRAAEEPKSARRAAALARACSAAARMRVPSSYARGAGWAVVGGCTDALDVHVHALHTCTRL